MIHSGIPTFVASEYVTLDEVKGYDVAVIGMPDEMGLTYRGGASEAPRKIRECSMWNKIFSTLKDYLILSLASILFAMGWECFMIPNGMSAGGMMGLCTVIQYATGGLVQAQYSYIAINALLILIAVLAERTQDN